jgi:hypothetical protein
MNRFFGMSVVALAMAAAPTQTASAWGGGGGGFRIGLGFHFNFEFGGLRFERPCWGCGHQHHRHAQYIATFPGMEHHQPGDHPHQPFPPAPGQERRDPKRERQGEESAAYWGYPNLNYSYEHPVSYSPAAFQPSYYPSISYPVQNYYPGNYQAPGMSFDR